MAKHTLNILRYEYRKIFEVCFAIFQHYSWQYLTVLSKANQT